MFTQKLYEIYIYGAIIQIVVIAFNYKKFYFNRFNLALRQVFGIIPALIFFFLLSEDGSSPFVDLPSGDLSPFCGTELILFFSVFVFYNLIPTIALIVFTMVSSFLFHEFWPTALIFGVYACIAYFTRQNENF